MNLDKNSAYGDFITRLNKAASEIYSKRKVNEKYYLIINEKNMEKVSKEIVKTVTDIGSNAFNSGQERGDGINTLSYKTYFDFGQRFSYPVFKIFSDFFNIIYQNKDKQTLYDINDISFMFNGRFQNNVTLGESLNNPTHITFKHKDLTLLLAFDKFIDSGEMVYLIRMYSREVTNFIDERIYSNLFELALQESDIKGKFIEMSNNKFDWKINKLEERSFDDIYLPKDIMDNVSLFYDIFKEKEVFLRYLMVGNPGTGKTESTLVLSNELNKLGVTIIKTSIDKFFKEKVELAEILKPSIIISDDIDLSLGSRDNGSYSEKLGLFLDILDGTNKISKGVGFLCATNSASFLDLAAQRPGRFDKVLLFDSITKDNIKNIILKSLKYNFNIDKEDTTKIFVNDKIINKYFESKVTGAHIYNSINMLKMKLDSLKIVLNEKWLMSEIVAEIDTIEKIKKHTKMSHKMNNNVSTSIGFKRNDDEIDLIDGNDACEKIHR